MINRSKYGSKKSVVGGITFHSKKEGERFLFLKSLEGRQVFDLELQPSFILVPSFKLDGETVRAMKYVSDFKYKNISGETIVEDMKGFLTDSYKIKIKLFKWLYCQKHDFKFFEIYTAGDTRTMY